LHEAVTIADPTPSALNLPPPAELSTLLSFDAQTQSDTVALAPVFASTEKLTLLPCIVVAVVGESTIAADPFDDVAAALATGILIPAPHPVRGATGQSKNRAAITMATA
jgi:hypothetical protein